MARNKKVEEVVEVVAKEAVIKQDIIIDCRITTPDGKGSSRRVKITHPTGCIRSSQINNPEGVFQTLFAGLVKKYGAGHIK